MISFPTLLLRLVVAIVLGAVIGLEREANEHSAGLRTQALVSLGSALFTIISAYGFLSMLTLPHVQVDPTRIASYIVAGIGFLGGGSIFLARNQQVKGLTTAASVWLVAALGMACGVGLLVEAMAATALALIVLVVLRLAERAFALKPVPHQHLFITASSLSGPLLQQIYATCERMQVAVASLKIHEDQGQDTIEIVCRIPDKTLLPQFVDALRTLPDVHTVQLDLQGSEKEDLKAQQGKRA